MSSINLEHAVVRVNKMREEFDAIVGDAGVVPTTPHLEMLTDPEAVDLARRINKLATISYSIASSQQDGLILERMRLS